MHKRIIMAVATEPVPAPMNSAYRAGRKSYRYMVVYRVHVLLIYGVSMTHNFEDKVSSIYKKVFPWASNQRFPVHQPPALPSFLAATHRNQHHQS